MGHGRTLATGWGIGYGFVAFFMLPGLEVCYILSFFFLDLFFFFLSSYDEPGSLVAKHKLFLLLPECNSLPFSVKLYFDTTRIVKSAVQIKAGLTINCQSLLIKVSTVK